MAESHVLIALRVRRADLANDIRGMNEALAHLDATIRLLEEGVASKFKQRELSREVFEAIRSAGRPLTSTEIARKIDAPLKRVMGTLCYQRDKGRVRGVQERGKEIVWEFAG
jgi:hypothetical protein